MRFVLRIILCLFGFLSACDNRTTNEDTAKLRQRVATLEGNLEEQAAAMKTLSDRMEDLGERTTGAERRLLALERTAAALGRKTAARPLETIAAVGADSRIPAATPEADTRAVHRPDPGPRPDEAGDPVRSPSGPGIWEKDEPYMRVGSRSGFVEVSEIVEELPDYTGRWVRRLLRRLQLDEVRAKALVEAIEPAVEPLQVLGRTYLAGELDKEELRRRFWNEWQALDARVAVVLSEDELARFRALAAEGLATDEHLPQLLGEAPTQ